MNFRDSEADDSLFQEITYGRIKPIPHVLARLTHRRSKSHTRPARVGEDKPMGTPRADDLLSCYDIAKSKSPFLSKLERFDFLNKEQAVEKAPDRLPPKAPGRISGSGQGIILLCLRYGVSPFLSDDI